MQGKLRKTIPFLNNVKIKRTINFKRNYERPYFKSISFDDI